MEAFRSKAGGGLRALQTLALQDCNRRPKPGFSLAIHAGGLWPVRGRSNRPLAEVGWPTGLEPATTSSTSLDSTIELWPPTNHEPNFSGQPRQAQHSPTKGHHDHGARTGVACFIAGCRTPTCRFCLSDGEEWSLSVIPSGPRRELVCKRKRRVRSQICDCVGPEPRRVLKRF